MGIPNHGSMMDLFGKCEMCSRTGQPICLHFVRLDALRSIIMVNFQYDDAETIRDALDQALVGEVSPDTLMAALEIVQDAMEIVDGGQVQNSTSAGDEDSSSDVESVQTDADSTE